MGFIARYINKTIYKTGNTLIVYYVPSRGAACDWRFAIHHRFRYPMFYIFNGSMFPYREFYYVEDSSFKGMGDYSRCEKKKEAFRAGYDLSYFRIFGKKIGRLLYTYVYFRVNDLFNEVYPRNLINSFNESKYAAQIVWK